MKCDPNDHRIVLAVDVFCKNCPQKWSPEQPQPQPKCSCEKHVAGCFGEVLCPCSCHEQKEPDLNEAIHKGLDKMYGCPQCARWRCGEAFRKEYCGCACHGGSIPVKDSPQPTKDTGGERLAPKVMEELYTLSDAFNKEHDEEREFRRALIEYLELPNLGNRGEHITFGELTAKQYALRKFL